MKKLIKFTTISSILAILSLGSQPAHAIVKFLGIGNDEFANDINVSSAALSPFLGPDDIISLHFNLNGAEILEELLNAKNMLQNGDIFIFHYSGHGEAPFIPDATPIDEGGGNEGIIGLVGDFPPLNPRFPEEGWDAPRIPADEDLVARDDEIGMIINMIPESVGVLSIFDSCYSGEMIDGTEDINRGLVIGTADATCPAPGGSIFLPEWLRSLSSNGIGSVIADTNNDTLLTLGELFNSLSLITTRGHISNPYAANFETEEHLNYTVANTPIPEPTATISLLSLGILGAGATLKRQLKPSNSIEKETTKVG